ncbi:MAG: hypothetical protein FD180_90 [Planctomycetota bacterium]|nr:MAG: hypothetical protein FD180_90 [Planctomycetota bacterium]
MVKHKSAVKHPESSLLDRIAECFSAQFKDAGLASPELKPTSSLSPADLEFAAEVGPKKVDLLVAVRNNLEPRLARAALFDLNLVSRHRPGCFTILAGTFISPRVRELCRESGVGYFDLMGNVYLRFETVLIDRSSAQRPPAADRPLKTVFSWKASRIVRHLLSNPKEAYEVQQLAQVCDVSLGLASKVKTRLIDLDYARHSKDGVHVVRPEALLRDWAAHYSWRSHEILDCFGKGSMDSLEGELCQLCTSRSLEFGLTLFSGAARRAPMVDYARGFAYVQAREGGLGRIARELGWKPVPSGANFTLLAPADAEVLINPREWGGAKRIVSDLQLYLDLASFSGRGEEAAEQILEQRIRPTW